MIRNTNTYLGFAGAVPIDYSIVQQGILFTQSYWSSGLSILTYEAVDPWQATETLTAAIILLITGTALFSGILQYFFERKQHALE